MALDELSALARSLWAAWLMMLFLGIVAWAYWPKNKDRFRGYGEIPFKDEER